MQVNDNIRKQLGSWMPWMQELVESPIWDNLYRFLQSEGKSGKVILPKSSDTWKSLELCDKDKVKTIVLLQCPYATRRELKNGEKVNVANGIPLDCTNTKPYQQPSLYHWFRAIEDQYGFHPDNDVDRCDLSYLLQEEHVLLLNSSNTVELNKVDSHSTQWYPITQWFIENVVNRYLNGIPVVLVGTQAQKFEKFLVPMANPILKVEHPAAAAHQDRAFRHQNMHKWINEVIKANNGEEYQINWLRQKPTVVREKKVTTNKGPVTKDLPFDV